MLKLCYFIDSDILPTQVVLTQIGYAYNFLVTWTPLPEEILNHFIISISPPPLHGVSRIVTNAAAAYIRLGNNTSYNLTLSGSFCTNLTLTQEFTTGMIKLVVHPINIVNITLMIVYLKVHALFYWCQTLNCSTTFGLMETRLL